MSKDHYLFLTGRLADRALRRVVEGLAGEVGFDFSIQVMPITIAALLTPRWIARRLDVPEGVTRAMVPGHCLGDLSVIEEVAGVPVERGPVDLLQLPEHFGRQSDTSGYGQYDIEILAEIGAASRLERSEIVRRAVRLDADGADLIVLSCVPNETWPGVTEAVRAIRERGLRVAIGSFDPLEIESAAHAGAELVLSVNESNRCQAADWGCEVVAVPDDPSTLAGLAETVEFLAEQGVRTRIDPILHPIGFGFAESLGRFVECRRRWPEAQMMMGIGTVTGSTDVDSAGINVMLTGFCQEQSIHGILVGEEVNPARSSVKECHLARQLVHFAVTHCTPAKGLEPGLVMLRDAKLREHGPEGLEELMRQLSDPSPRIFAEGGRLHMIASKLHLTGNDPYDLFDELLAIDRRSPDLFQSFYLGYEMAKAVAALQLGKNYRQDEALDWGLLTVPELTRRERRALRMARRGDDSDCWDFSKDDSDR